MSTQEKVNDVVVSEANDEIYYEPQPERAGLAVVLAVVPLAMAVVALALVVAALGIHFLRMPVGIAWLETWATTVHGVLGAFIVGGLLLSVAALFMGYIAWFCLSPDMKPSALLSRFLAVGDTAISMGIVAGGALVFTCRRAILSQFSPDALMGIIDQSQGYIARGVVGVVLLALAGGLIVLLMKLRSGWEELDYSARAQKNIAERPELDRFCVILEYVPIEKKPEIIRMLRQYIGCDMATAKALVGAVPTKVLEDADVEDCEALVDFLMQEDARAHLEAE